jgi:hypothetical protein
MTVPVFATKWDFLLARVLFGVSEGSGDLLLGSQEGLGTLWVCWTDLELARQQLPAGYRLNQATAREVVRVLPEGVAVVVDPGTEGGLVLDAGYVDELRPQTTLNRAITETGSPRGLFWTADAPAGSLETQLNLALKPEWNVEAVNGVSTTLPQATHYVKADFPPGTTVFQGPTEIQVSSGVSDGRGVSIPGSILGGGEQIVPHPYFMRMWDDAAKADGADPAAVDVLMNLGGPFRVDQ